MRNSETHSLSSAITFGGQCENMNSANTKLRPVWAMELHRGVKSVKKLKIDRGYGYVVLFSG